jgi:tRNA (cmo5U34)-methyltransferase
LNRVWQSPAVTRTYLRDVRGAIPLAAEQIDILLRVIGAAGRQVERFLDLGCGDGILAAALLERHPRARGVLLDFSEPMLAAARQKLRRSVRRLRFVCADYSAPAWIRQVREGAPFDAIVSGFSIHHQPDRRKRALYAEIFGLLRPGGVFLNLEHVSSPSRWIESAWDDYMIDALHRFHRGEPRDQVARRYHFRPDKQANILAPMERQCRWLRRIGFEDVDCFFKSFELALFGGRRPA